MNPDALSPSEDITLRRVHYGLAKPGEMIAGDIDRLVSLGLIVRQGSSVVLTVAGQHRLRNLPRYDQQLNKLVEMLTKVGR